MRVLDPTIAATELYWRYRRDSAYRWAAERFVSGGMERVVDLGCGVGAGTATLACAGLDVLGVDASERSVRHAAHVYRFGKISFHHSDVTRTTLAQHRFDGVVVCGALERLHDGSGLIEEARRLLRPMGVLIVITPHRLTCSPGRTLPICGEHLWEYTADELNKLMRSRFSDLHMFGHFHGPAIRRVERLTGRALSITLRSIPPSDRAGWLRAALRRVSPADFTIQPGTLRHSVDLVAVAR